MSDNAAGQPPIFFIMGRPRSGTTLLSTLFDAHPNVKIPPEFPIMLPLYQRFRKVKNWDEAAIRQFVGFIFQHNVFIHRTLENLKIDREEFTAGLLKMQGKGTIRDFLKAVNASGYSLFPKEEILMIGDKNPVYSIYTKRFMKIFPDARFVCIIRDYRDNFVSMRKLADLKLEAPSLVLQVYRWKYVARLFLACREKHPDRFHLIRYEDLVEKPETVMQDICAFLGLPYEPSVFDFHRKKEETMKTYNNPLIERFHGSLMNPVNKSRMDQWKTSLTPAKVAMADQVAGRYADRLGYERANRKFNLWLWVRSKPLSLYGYLIFKVYVYGSYLPAGLSLWLSVKLLVLVRAYHRIFIGESHPVKPAVDK
jgi:hypothetical protein